MLKFSKGDVLFLRQHLVIGKYYDDVYFARPMEWLKENPPIVHATRMGVYTLFDGKGEEWYLNDDMLDIPKTLNFKSIVLGTVIEFDPEGLTFEGTTMKVVARTGEVVAIDVDSKVIIVRTATDRLVKVEPKNFVGIYAPFVGESVEFVKTKDGDIDISQPSYYTKGIETKDYIRSHDLNFNRGSAIKYVTRAGDKDPDKKIEDLQKAINFIQFEIDYIRDMESEKSCD